MIEITPTDIDTYATDGVICLRNAFDAGWVDRLTTALQARMDAPGPRAADFNTAPGDKRFFSDMFMWRDDAAFRAAALDSPAAEIAARVMGSCRADFFYDQAFSKEPGAMKPTPWHQDLPYWPVKGEEITSVWIALDEVTQESGAVEFVIGSHKFDTLYRPVPFGAPNAINRDYENSPFEPLPDIENMRDTFSIVSFDMEPGDCLVFHARIIHGAPGNSRADRRRRSLALRYTGDDARYDPRKGTFPLPADPGLSAGAPMECALFPAAYPAKPV